MVRPVNERGEVVHREHWKVDHLCRGHRLGPKSVSVIRHQPGCYASQSLAGCGRRRFVGN